MTYIRKSNFNMKQDLTSQVATIDETLTERSAQVTDLSVQSYSLGLLRDPNEAGKKIGQEFVEFVTAVVSDENTEACEAEFADLIYAGLVFARSRQKDVKLAHVMEILVARNQSARPDEASISKIQELPESV
jgi:phosphoribosyl-ATP pyrophosphohydrolase